MSATEKLAISLPRDLIGKLRRAKAEGRGKIVLYQHQGYLLEPERSPESPPSRDAGT